MTFGWSNLSEILQPFCTWMEVSSTCHNRRSRRAMINHTEDYGTDTHMTCPILPWEGWYAEGVGSGTTVWKRIGFLLFLIVLMMMMMMGCLVVGARTFLRFSGGRYYTRRGRVGVGISIAMTWLQRILQRRRKRQEEPEMDTLAHDTVEVSHTPPSSFDPPHPPDNSHDSNIGCSSSSSRPSSNTTSLSQGTQSRPQSPNPHTRTSTHLLPPNHLRSTKRRTLAVGTIPYNHTISHPHQLHHLPISFHSTSSSSYSNPSIRTSTTSTLNQHNRHDHPDHDNDNDNDDDGDDNNDEEENDNAMTQFHKSYPHIRLSSYAKLCLPPTCQHIPLPTQNHGSSTHPPQSSHVTSYVFFPHHLTKFYLQCQQLILWIFAYEYWSKFFFLFLPSGGSIIYKMLFRKGGYQVTELKDDDETEEEKVEIEKNDKEEKEEGRRGHPHSYFGNRNPIMGDEKKMEWNNGIEEPEEERVEDSSLLGRTSAHLQSHSSSPSSPSLHEKDVLAPYRSTHSSPKGRWLFSQNRHTPTTNTTTKSSSLYPHISSIFPSKRKLISSTSPLNASASTTTTTTNPTIPIPTPMDPSTPSDNLSQSPDPPMNFFDAQTSSDGIHDLSQKFPVVPDKHGYIFGNIGDRRWNGTPLLVFVNSRAGPQQGHVLLHQCKCLLNPIQVWDLGKDGDPEVILESFSVLKTLRILVCGGDGTVSWILSAIGRVYQNFKFERWPPVAILPLGTGNDLARVHGWGGGYSNESLLGILNQVQDAYVTLLDRWDLTVTDQKGKIREQKCFTNYVGVGVDAQVSFQMHMVSLR